MVKKRSNDPRGIMAEAVRQQLIETPSEDFSSLVMSMDTETRGNIILDAFMAGLTKISVRTPQKLNTVVQGITEGILEEHMYQIGISGIPSKKRQGFERKIRRTFYHESPLTLGKGSRRMRNSLIEAMLMTSYKGYFSATLVAEFGTSEASEVIMQLKARGLKIQKIVSGAVRRFCLEAEGYSIPEGMKTVKFGQIRQDVSIHRTVTKDSVFESDLRKTPATDDEIIFDLNDKHETAYIKGARAVANMAYTFDSDYMKAMTALLKLNKLSSMLIGGKSSDVKAVKNKVDDIRLAHQSAVKQWDGEEFYFDVKLSEIGRIFPIGIITPVSSKPNRAALRFNEKKALGDSGMKDLLVFAAGAAGLDKSTWGERLAWGLENRSKLEEIGAILMGNRPKDGWVLLRDGGYDNVWETASCALELARIKSFTDNGGVEKDFLSNMPVMVDACNSGSQLTAVITRDRYIATATNVCSTKPAQGANDVYGFVRDTMMASVSSFPVTDEADTTTAAALQTLDSKILRKLAKKCFMPTGYGATRASLVPSIFELTSEMACFKNDQRAERLAFAKYMVNLFFHVYNTSPEFAGLADYQRFIKDVDDAYYHSDSVGSTTWVIPSLDGEADQIMAPKYYEPTSVQYDTMVMGRRRKGNSYSFMVGNTLLESLDENASLQVAKNASHRAVAPLSIHGVDALVLHTVINRMDRPLFTIHDSIGCHAGELDELQETIRMTYADLAETDIVRSHQAKCLADTGVEVELPKTMINEQMTREEILNGLYCFC